MSREANAHSTILIRSITMTSCLSWRHRGGRLLGAAGLALLLAACGGGSGDTAAPAGATVITEVPASATVSAEAYSGFASTLAAQSDGTAEPIDLAMVVPPTSETAEPVELR